MIPSPRPPPGAAPRSGFPRGMYGTPQSTAFSPNSSNGAYHAPSPRAQMAMKQGQSPCLQAASPGAIQHGNMNMRMSPSPSGADVSPRGFAASGTPPPRGFAAGGTPPAGINFAPRPAAGMNAPARPVAPSPPYQMKTQPQMRTVPPPQPYVTPSASAPAYTSQPRPPPPLRTEQVQPPARRRSGSGGAGAHDVPVATSKAIGVPPPVARGPQPTCMEPTRLPNGQRIKKVAVPQQPMLQHSGDRRASRFASMRQLPGGVQVKPAKVSDGDMSNSFFGSDDAGEKKNKAKKLPKTGPGAAGFRPVERKNDPNVRKIKTTIGNDDTWMKGLTYTTWIDSPTNSARGENAPYKRKPNNNNTGRRKKKSSNHSLTNDDQSYGMSNSSLLGMNPQPKKTFVDKLKALFAS